ncbi:MAG: 3-hydroxyacyl-ACP dehydratase FabZ family protein [Pirellulales bacterium]
MRFTFVDRILDLQPGVKITTLKCLSLGEEYLADHFPRFPVMPGVLMLESMTEAGAWLIRASEGFTHSIVTLKEARNILFADFVQPGRVLTVTAEILKLDDREVQLKTQGLVEGRIAVRGRLTLERYNLADKRPDLAAADDHLKQNLRAHLALIYRPQIDVDSAPDAGLIAAATPSNSPPGTA